MNRKHSLAFTLIEMLTVMAVIAILASLIVAVNAFAHKKAALLRADGEIHAMTTACENYKGDFGAYPRSDDSDLLDPRTNGNPLDPKYIAACITLYKALSGDAKQGTSPTPAPTPTDKPDGKPETKGYFEFRPDMLKKDSAGNILTIQDPFGNSYGYSSAGATAEGTFRVALQADPNTPRPPAIGFNPNFDLWCTGGVINREVAKLNDDRKRWIKNW